MNKLSARALEADKCAEKTLAWIERLARLEDAGCPSLLLIAGVADAKADAHAQSTAARFGWALANMGVSAARLARRLARPDIFPYLPAGDTKEWQGWRVLVADDRRLRIGRPFNIDQALRAKSLIERCFCEYAAHAMPDAERVAQLAERMAEAHEADAARTAREVDPLMRRPFDGLVALVDQALKDQTVVVAAEHVLGFVAAYMRSRAVCAPGSSLSKFDAQPILNVALPQMRHIADHGPSWIERSHIINRAYAQVARFQRDAALHAPARRVAYIRAWHAVLDPLLETFAAPLPTDHAGGLPLTDHAGEVEPTDHVGAVRVALPLRLARALPSLARCFPSGIVFASAYDIADEAVTETKQLK